MKSKSSLVVGPPRAVLMSASPSWPPMDVVERSGVGDQVCQETADLGKGERNEAVIGFGAPFLARAEVGVAHRTSVMCRYRASYRRTW